MRNDKLSPHFNLREFRCKKDYRDCPYCGGSIRVRDIVVYQAEATPLEILRWQLRQMYGTVIEVIISSGDRCQRRNSEVSHLDDPELSWHWRGCAIDIFARRKRDKAIIALSPIYEEAVKIWPPDNVSLEGDHIHITLVEIYETVGPRVERTTLD